MKVLGDAMLGRRQPLGSGGLGSDRRGALTRIERWSTRDVPASHRFAYWQDIFAGPSRSMSIDGEPEAFHGAITRLISGDLELTSVTSSGLLTRALSGDPTPEKRFSLHLVHSGRCHLRHGSGEFVAETGDMLLVDARKPYELSFEKPVQGLVLSLPCGRFDGQAPILEKLVGRRLNRGGGPSAVLSGFARSAWDNLVERDGEEWPHSASEVMWDLLTSILRDDRAAEAIASRAEDLRHRAAALVGHQLSDPEFRSAMIAEELGVSARYLQHVFALVGTTPARFLLARRLDAVATRLRYAEKPCRITDVALECGFSDLSYFSRAFRRRFGVAARRYRSERDGDADWT